MTYRVIVDGNSGDGFRFRIEDLYDFDAPEKGQIVGHGKDVLAENSIAALRQKLRAMLAACDKPPLAFRTGIVEVNLE